LLQYYSYSNAYTESLTYEDDALEAAYADDKQSYDRVFWEYVVVDGQAESTEDAEGNTVEPTEEEQDAALEQAHHTAEEILAGYASGASLSELAAAYENATYSMSTTTTYYGDAVSEWLFDEARTNGDTDIIADGTTFCVALFHSRGRDESPTIDVRHILITPESGKLTSEDEGYAAEQEALKAAAKEEAEAILEEWKAGEATEDSFAALAMERSADSNAASGGLYEAVYPGQMVAEFNDWCFDPARQSGDTAVVETSYGAHVMYFVGPNAERWKTQVSATLRNKDVAAWAEELIADADVVRNDAGLSRIG
ncbi:MAG: peptidylprolyl isomerase, partial [Oscillibacter sp.]|nr:peptidylprolyl isomerase [Oscillibacter sp.]